VKTGWLPVPVTEARLTWGTSPSGVTVHAISIPIADLTATEVYQFLRFLEAPAAILDKEPSAGLYDGQTDEGEMGISYGCIRHLSLGGVLSRKRSGIIMEKVSPDQRTQAQDAFGLRRTPMKICPGFLNLKDRYLFTLIAQKVREYEEQNPKQEIIRLGIGDVTLPLSSVVVSAMQQAVGEMGRGRDFPGLRR